MDLPRPGRVCLVSCVALIEPCYLTVSFGIGNSSERVRAEKKSCGAHFLQPNLPVASQPVRWQCPRTCREPSESAHLAACNSWEGREGGGEGRRVRALPHDPQHECSYYYYTCCCNTLRISSHSLPLISGRYRGPNAVLSRSAVLSYYLWADLKSLSVSAKLLCGQD